MPDDAFVGGAAIVAVRLTCANPCIANGVQPAIKIPPIWQPHVPGRRAVRHSSAGGPGVVVSIALGWHAWHRPSARPLAPARRGLQLCLDRLGIESDRFRKLGQALT